MDKELDQPADQLRLVECVYCDTRFGLPPELIDTGGEDDPELHCSRCGNLFALQENRFYGSENEYISTKDFQPAPIEATDFIEEETSEREEETIIHELEELPAQPPSEPEELPLFSNQPDAPRPSMQLLQPGGGVVEEPRNDSFNDWDVLAPKKRPQSDLFIPTTEEEEDEESSTVIDVAVGDTSTHATIERSEFRLQEALSDPAFQPAVVNQISPHTSTFFLASPLIGFVLLLFGFGEFLQGTDPSQLYAQKMISQSLTSAPPADMYLDRLTFRKLSLISGEEVFLVDGQLVNESDTAVSAGQVEVILFDGVGKVISQKVITAGKPLEHAAQIPSAEVLFSLEQQQATIENTIEQEERRPIAVYFNAQEAQDAKFFSARIFSVNQ